MAGISLSRRVVVTALGTLTACIALGMTGCQPVANSSVAALPPPTFNGPNLAAPPPVAVAPPTAIAPRPVAPVTGPAAWRPTVPPRSWQWIVIHHSATPGGNAAVFNKLHQAKGWDEMGYHFVIGNGTDSGNGQVEVGGRWSRQKWGAHAKTADNRYNELGIGICLVGNFDVERPTPAQMKSLNQLVAYLMKTYRVPADRIIGHGDTKATDCPGKFMSIAQVRRGASSTLAAAGAPSDVGAPEEQPSIDAVAASSTETLAE